MKKQFVMDIRKKVQRSESVKETQKTHKWQEKSIGGNAAKLDVNGCCSRRSNETVIKQQGKENDNNQHYDDSQIGEWVAMLLEELKRKQGTGHFNEILVSVRGK
jgi:hypothetical protein